MSVMCIDKEVLAEIVATLENDLQFAKKIIPVDELNEAHKFGIKEADKITQYIECLFDRLHISNQLAFKYQYNELTKAGLIEQGLSDPKKDSRHTIEKLDFSRLEKSDIEWYTKDNENTMSFEIMEKYLVSLMYNLFTNAGRAFVSKEDLKAVETLREICKLRVKN